MKIKNALLVPGLVHGIVLLAGCGSGAPAGPAADSSGELRGQVRGGQQPIRGANIQMYAVGTTGYGSTPAALLPSNLYTDGGGNFNLNGLYTCPSGTTQVYLVARGGNPGLTAGTDNQASVLLAALGNCAFASASTTVVSVNEATTVAGVWALSQFMSSGGKIGTSATNLVGIQNAFAAVGNLINLGTGKTPGPALPAGATDQHTKLYTLANVLAGCVNSTGSGAACGVLFSAATSGGVAPANTLDAALNVVRNPAANIAAIFNIAPPTGPFQPSLSAAPADWTMGLTFGNCASCGGLSLPTSVALDSQGNVWVANYSGGAVSKFTNSGQPISNTGFAGGLFEAYGLTVDGNDHVWVTNEETGGGLNGGHGSLTVFNSNGNVISGSGYGDGGIYFPVAASADTNGTIWVANYGRSSVTALTNGGTAISGGTGFAGSALAFPVGVAIDGNHNAWVAHQNGTTIVSADGSTAVRHTCCTGPAGIALDGLGDVWVADYYGTSFSLLSAAGTVLVSQGNSGGVAYPKGVAIDGGGTAWLTNYHGASVSAVAGSTATTPGAGISPSTGYGRDVSLSEPYGVAIDASGNVWVTSFGNDLLVELIGAATPLKNPLLGLPQLP